MAYLLSRGTGSDLAIRFNKRKAFVKAILKQIDEAEVDGSYVVVSIHTEPERCYEQEYKKVYRKKNIAEKGHDIKESVALLKAILGWG